MARFWLGIAVIVLFSVSGRAALAQPSGPSPDVVILALGSTQDEREFATVRAVLKLAGEKAPGATLRDIQMDIVRKTAPFGPVLLLVPDDTSYNEVIQNCASTQLCSLLREGRLRLAVVPHDSAWLRDYGPFIESLQDGQIKVVDSAYYDVRSDDKRAELLERIAERRIELLEHAMSTRAGRNPLDELTRADAPDDLGLLTQYAAVLREQADYRQRTHDDRASFAIAQSLLGNHEFSYIATPLYLDGGNLLKLDDRACLTTTALAQRNPGKQSELSAQLKALYDCRSVSYLQPLPGQVIEHVDMFVLPAGGTKLLLPDYRLDQPHVEKAWRRANNLERDLTVHAAFVMEQNATALRAQGYEVELVPALLPRVRGESQPYYPTMLNALVRAGANRQVQVLVPTYAGLDAETQTLALARIREQFGDDADVQEIEATVAARGQGAVHCLTITAPLAISVFRERPLASLATIIDQRAALDIADLPSETPTLRGTWSATPLGAGTTAPRNSIEFVFTDSKISITVGDQKIVGDYTLKSMQSRRWEVEISFEGETKKTSARVEWRSARSFNLVLPDGDSLVLSRPLDLIDLTTDDRELAINVAAKGTLSDEDEVEASESLGQAWLVKGNKDQTVKIDVRSTTFDVEAMLVGPGLEMPLHDDDSGDSKTNARLIVTFPDDGEYKLIVKAFDNNGSGDFSIEMVPFTPVDNLDKWIRLVPAELWQLPVGQRRLRIGKSTEGTLAQDAPVSASGKLVQAWTLDRCKGQRVRIELKSDDFDPVLMVAARGMERPLVNDDEVGTNSAIEFDCAKDETYLVVVSSWESGGKFEITTIDPARVRRN